MLFAMPLMMLLPGLPAHSPIAKRPYIRTIDHKCDTILTWLAFSGQAPIPPREPGDTASGSDRPRCHRGAPGQDYVTRSAAAARGHPTGLEPLFQATRKPAPLPCGPGIE